MHIYLSANVWAVIAAVVVCSNEEGGMLTTEQIGFFKANGYLLLPGVMDLDLCARVREAMWDSLPENAEMCQDNPDTHLGPFPEGLQSADSLHTRMGYRWLNRHLGVTEDVVSLIYSDTICAMAQQLLGGQLRQVVSNGEPMGSRGPAWPGGPTDPAVGTDAARGVYCTLPYGEKPREPDACHTDGHPFQLGVVGLLDDSPQDGGAFKVWPASHRTLYPTFTLRYDQPRIPYYEHLPSAKGIVHSPEYLAEIERLNAEVQPVECWGRAGDIVFWHHRTAHMAGHNYTDVMRQAVLADFWTEDLDHFRTTDAQGDMWRDWSEEVQGVALEYSQTLAKDQRLVN